MGDILRLVARHLAGVENVGLGDVVVFGYFFSMRTPDWPATVITGALCLGLTACDDDDEAASAVDLMVIVENVSMPGQLDGEHDITVSSGVWLIHPDANSGLFEEGVAAPAELEPLAEDGSTEELAERFRDAGSLTGRFGGTESGDTYADSAVGPGRVIGFDVSAMSDERLSIASMFINSNDVVLATVPEGISIDIEAGVTVEVTDQFGLWDAGTEANEQPGVGESQPARQPEPNFGGPGEGQVSRVDGRTDSEGFAYPAVADFVRVTMRRSE